jgi:hypothetical protein
MAHEESVAAMNTPETQEAEESLVAASRAGDRTAFARLVERYFGAVWAVAYARLDHAMAGGAKGGNVLEWRLSASPEQFTRSGVHSTTGTHRAKGLAFAIQLGGPGIGADDWRFHNPCVAGAIVGSGIVLRGRGAGTLKSVIR